MAEDKDQDQFISATQQVMPASVIRLAASDRRRLENEPVQELTPSEELEREFRYLSGLHKTAALTTTELTRLTLEIVNGKEPTVPDTPRLAEMRRELLIEISEIRAAGGIVEVPSEHEI